MKRISIIAFVILIGLAFFACDSDSDSDNDGGSTGNLIESIRNADIIITVDSNDSRMSYISVSISTDIVDCETFTGTFTHSLTLDGEDMSQYQGNYPEVDRVGYYLESNLVAGQTYAITYKLQLFVDGVNTLTKEVSGSINCAHMAVWDTPEAPTTPGEEVTFYWAMDGNNTTQIAFASTEYYNSATDSYPGDDFYIELPADARSYTYPVNCVADYSNFEEYSLWYSITSCNYYLGGGLAIISETDASCEYGNWRNAPKDRQKAHLSNLVKFLRSAE